MADEIKKLIKMGVSNPGTLYRLQKEEREKASIYFPLPISQKVEGTVQGDLSSLMVGGMLCIKPILPTREGKTPKEYKEAMKEYNQLLHEYKQRRNLYSNYTERSEEEIKEFCNKRYSDDTSPLKYGTHIGTKYRSVSIGDGGMSIDDEIIIDGYEDELAQQTFGKGEHRRKSPQYNPYLNKNDYELREKRVRRAFLNAKNEWQRAVANGDEDVEELYQDYLDAKEKYHEEVENIMIEHKEQTSLDNCRTEHPHKYHIFTDDFIRMVEEDEVLEFMFFSTWYVGGNLEALVEAYSSTPTSSPRVFRPTSPIKRKRAKKEIKRDKAQMVLM